MFDKARNAQAFSWWLNNVSSYRFKFFVLFQPLMRRPDSRPICYKKTTTSDGVSIKFDVCDSLQNKGIHWKHVDHFLWPSDYDILRLFDSKHVDKEIFYVRSGKQKHAGNKLVTTGILEIPIQYQVMGTSHVKMKNQLLNTLNETAIQCSMQIIPGF